MTATPAKIEKCDKCGWQGLAELLADHTCDRDFQDRQNRAFWATVEHDHFGGRR